MKNGLFTRFSSFICGRVFGFDGLVKEVLQERSEWDVVFNTSRRVQRKEQAITRPYEFTFTGSFEDFEFLRTACEAGAPSLFKISYAGVRGSYNIGQNHGF